MNVGNDIAVQFQNVERGTSDYASTGIPPTEWKNVVQKYGLNRKDGRVQVRSLLDIRYVAMNHARPLFQNNPGLAKASTGPSTARRSRRRAATSTASAPGRSSRPGCSATSRRGSTRCA